MCHVYSTAKCKGEFAEDMDILEHLTSMLNSSQSSNTRNKQSCMSVINELITQLEKCSHINNFRVADGSSQEG